MSPPMAPDPSWDSTLSLLTRARAGDDEALNDLFARYVPVLQRWATGRLPQWARDLTETHDLVQDVLLRSFKKVEGFEHRGEGAFQAYLRKHRPPLLAVWGKNDPFFLPAGAEAFKRDVPNAEVRLIDAGHFALEAHAPEIAALIADFLARHLQPQAALA